MKPKLTPKVTNKEDLRGVFFIIKGQYKHHSAPTFYNRETEEEQCLGGYNPEDKNTSEWYMVMDRKEYNCIACGSSLEKVKESIYIAIRKHKTLDRYREVLRKLPKSQKVSKPMRCLYEAVEETYGYYFEDEVREMEDKAYNSGVFKTPLQRTQEMKKRNTVTKLKKATPKPKVGSKSATKGNTLKKKGNTLRPRRKLSLS